MEGGRERRLLFAVLLPVRVGRSGGEAAAGAWPARAAAAKLLGDMGEGAGGEAAVVREAATDDEAAEGLRRIMGGLDIGGTSTDAGCSKASSGAPPRMCCCTCGIMRGSCIASSSVLCRYASCQ